MMESGGGRACFSRCLALKIKGKKEQWSSPGKCSEEGEEEVGNKKMGQTGGKQSFLVIQAAKSRTGC